MLCAFLNARARRCRKRDGYLRKGSILDWPWEPLQTRRYAGGRTGARVHVRDFNRHRRAVRVVAGAANAEGRSEQLP